jgi:hypothetical protein
MNKWVDITKFDSSNHSVTNKKLYNWYAEQHQKNMWLNVIHNLNAGKYLTHEVRKKFTQWTNQQARMQFTHSNVFNLVFMLFNNSDQIMGQAIEAILTL